MHLKVNKLWDARQREALTSLLDVAAADEGVSLTVDDREYLLDVIGDKYESIKKSNPAFITKVKSYIYRVAYLRLTFPPCRFPFLRLPVKIS